MQQATVISKYGNAPNPVNLKRKIIGIVNVHILRQAAIEYRSQVLSYPTFYSDKDIMLA